MRVHTGAWAKLDSSTHFTLLQHGKTHVTTTIPDWRGIFSTKCIFDIIFIGGVIIQNEQNRISFVYVVLLSIRDIWIPRTVNWSTNLKIDQVEVMCC